MRAAERSIAHPSSPKAPGAIYISDATFCLPAVPRTGRVRHEVGSVVHLVASGEVLPAVLISIIAKTVSI